MCFLKLSGELYSLPQPSLSHLSLLLTGLWIFAWFLRWSFRWKVLSQCEQWYWRKSEWIKTWRTSLNLEENALKQWSQTKGFSPECAYMCWASFPGDVKLFRHIEQTFERGNSDNAALLVDGLSSINGSCDVPGWSKILWGWDSTGIVDKVTWGVIWEEVEAISSLNSCRFEWPDPPAFSLAFFLCLRARGEGCWIADVDAIGGVQQVQADPTDNEPSYVDTTGRWHIEHRESAALTLSCLPSAPGGVSSSKDGDSSGKKIIPVNFWRRLTSWLYIPLCVHNIQIYPSRPITYLLRKAKCLPTTYPNNESANYQDSMQMITVVCMLQLINLKSDTGNMHTLKDKKRSKINERSNFWELLKADC